MNLRTDFKYCFKDKESMYWFYECHYQMAISECQVNPFTARKTHQVVKAWQLSLLIISLLLPFSVPASDCCQIIPCSITSMLSTATSLKYDGKTSELTLLIMQQYYVRSVWQVLSKPKRFARKLSLKWELALFLQKTLISSDIVSWDLHLSFHIFHISFL